jgi:phage repressor protein C with HTH and peptisase S24 domain
MSTALAGAIWSDWQQRRPEKLSMLAAVKPEDIPDRLSRAGRTQSDLARHLQLDPSSLTKTIKGQRRLKADELLKIEEFFEGEPPFSASVKRPQRRIPVYGYAAAGGEERIAYNAGSIIDFIDPPPLWNGAGDLVGLRILGDSMVPRLFEGELVIAQINLPPLRHQDCVIEMSDGSALVKTYKTATTKSIEAEQWNPQKPVVVDRARVKAVHAIIWRR